MANSEYYIRLVVLPRVVTGRTAANEPVESWPETADNKRYSAKPLALNAGEEIRQGVKESVDFLKLEIPGQSIPIEAVDRIRLIVANRVYRLTAHPIRQERSTVITCESV